MFFSLRLFREFSHLPFLRKLGFTQVSSCFSLRFLMAASDISNMCANRTLADGDDEDISMQVPNVPADEIDIEVGFYTVGRLDTEKPVKFPFFQNTMAVVWRLRMGVSMRQLQPRHFLFRFSHEANITCIINDGPFSY